LSDDLIFNQSRIYHEPRIDDPVEMLYTDDPGGFVDLDVGDGGPI
jgi:hypothetical protein